MLDRRHRKDATDVIFARPDGAPPGAVGVVGTFGGRQPGEGVRAVVVAPPVEGRRPARHLTAGDYWFDDEGADGRDDPRGLLRA
ncbi:hypothetical protein [Streptomyces sp. NPDC048606]|uniref:hypothetical protein n=1 Tax=Streptomyces sp. NPDC048606 TaxID=3154726 RepID=UPI00341F35C8